MAQARVAATGHDAEAVPLFGIRNPSRVPDSMKEGAPQDWRDLPEAQVEILPQYGAEHDNLVALRTELEQMKRTINAIGPFCETRLRCTQKLKKGGISEEETVATTAQDEEARKKRDAAFESIKLVVSKIEETDASTLETTKTRLEAIVNDVVEKGSKDFQSKEEFAEYWGFLRQQTSKIFAEQKKLLERIKVIKKAATAKPAAQPVAEAKAESATPEKETQGQEL